MVRVLSPIGLEFLQQRQPFLCRPRTGEGLESMSLPVGQRLHHLKLFFSNRFVYAQVLRKTDGHVSISLLRSQANIHARRDKTQPHSFSLVSLPPPRYGVGIHQASRLALALV